MVDDQDGKLSSLLRAMSIWGENFAKKYCMAY